MSVNYNHYLEFLQSSSLIDARTIAARDLPLQFPHDSLILALVRQGEGIFRIQGQDFTLSEGKLIFINLQCTAELISGSRDLFLKAVCLKSSYFRPEVLANLAAYPLFQSFIHTKQQKEVKRLCSHLIFERLPHGLPQLVELMENFQSHRKLHAQEELFFPLIALFDGLSPQDLHVFRDKPLPSQNLVSSKVQDILNYVDEHFQTASLSDLALRYHYSPNYLSNLIRIHSGTTFGQHLAQRRLSVAKDLLKNSTLDIGDIIQRVGYSDKSSFYRQFNRAFGCTPSELRERFANHDAEEKLSAVRGKPMDGAKKLSQGAC